MDLAGAAVWAQTPVVATTKRTAALLSFIWILLGLDTHYDLVFRYCTPDGAAIGNRQA
jgi:hypothetical protein